MNHSSNMARIRATLSSLRQNITRGFTLVELIIVVSIVAILSATALDRLFWYQGQAEKAAMEYTATMIKSGLWTTAASLMMDNRTSEISTLAQKNPINLLAQKPENYLGEVKSANTSSMASGNWFYDTDKQQVIYIVAHRRNFSATQSDDYTIRYGIKIIYAEMEISKGNNMQYIAGITFQPLTKYTWY